MRKLIAKFKNLPPEIRMMIALAGFGTPAAMIYGLKQFLFPGVPYRILILCVGGVIALIAGGGYLVSKGFKRGGKKRARRMESALAGDEDRGPVSMDVRAAIKSNNEKFFTAIREMRKNVGISVYDLPWYIVIGDSGCGKTKLVNEGGLTFSTGKPEGYQLGTLNYNWWFTEDAIFVDMAGRLCNPQDDADRKEWQAFLDTVGKGRKGYPINGALVCVSAEHLLADSPEKHEADANTTLERLRDLQSRLGVTFATYLVVTKCDKIPGFMQFFDRAERDITIKNQIFGWSKPGEFNELRDPEEFDQDFNTVYARLNELRLRRLNDESDEFDLGLAYGFPEEFRQFKEPLTTYVRTLFPMIKNPRAIKNLIFRGVYFTSATQEGELILRHLTERLGPDAADQFPRLDLYPNKRPHFIKDLLFRKVFPEHGLVFRNEQQAVRNREYNRLLKVGSVAMFALLFGTLILSSWKFSKVIVKPRQDAEAAYPDKTHTVPEAVNRTAELTGDIANLDDNMTWARLLSLWGAGQPKRDLATIRAGVFEKFLLRPALEDVARALRDTTLPPASAADDEAAAAVQNRFMAALEEYVAWLSCSDQNAPPPHITYDSFKTLYAIVSAPQETLAGHEQELLTQAEAYFKQLGNVSKPRNPARLLRASGGVPPEDTVRKAVAAISRHLEGYARLTSGHPHPLIREWMRIREQCVQIGEGYNGMLASATIDVRTDAQLKLLRDGFVPHYETFEAAIGNCDWRGQSQGPRKVIELLKPAILNQREVWLKYEKRLKDAHQRCEVKPDSSVSALLGALSKGGADPELRGLDLILWEELVDKKLTGLSYAGSNFEPKAFGEAVKEVPDVHAHLIKLVPGGGSDADRIVLAPDASKVHEAIRPIGEKLREANLGESDDAGTPKEWVEKLEGFLDAQEKQTAKLKELTLESPLWRASHLNGLREKFQTLIDRALATALLRVMSDRLKQVGDWGFADLLPDDDRLAAKPSVYNIPFPPARSSRSDSPAVASSPETGEEETEPQPGRRSRRSRASSKPAAETAEMKASEPVAKGDGSIPGCASREYFFKRAEECEGLLFDLEDFSFYLKGEGGTPLHEECRALVARAGANYATTYVRAWAKAYEAKRLQELDRLREKASAWSTLAGALQGPGANGKTGRNNVSDELQNAVEQILAAVPFWEWDYDKSAAGWTRRGDLDEGAWPQVRAWVTAAIEKEWPRNLGRFVVDARPPGQGFDAKDSRTPPWSAIAGGFASRWMSLAGAIEANADLPRDFSNPRTALTHEVPWGKIEALQKATRLEDETFTRQLVSFESLAQRLLSCELTNRIAEIQDRHFRGAQPDGGWPYLNVQQLDTVPLIQFREFLTDIDRAEQGFAILEQGIPPGDPQRAARSGFLQRCRDWEKFVGSGNQAGGVQNLNVSIDVIPDPISAQACQGAVQDGAQHYYREVVLNLGSSEQRIATSKETPGPGRQIEWRWDAAAGGAPKIVWTSGLPPPGETTPFPDVELDLGGGASALALCAYLHKYGARDGEQLVTCHHFDLKQKMQEQGKENLAQKVNEAKREIGIGLKFTLGRAMPEPVPRLATCANPTAGSTVEKRR